jgi:folate-binding protein YgfZ
LVPLSHYDLEENKSLLLENNFENLNSISWDKGCYVGQEITARMKYRSLLKKKIYSLEIKDGSPLIGQLIKDDESEFGKIISIKNNSVLAMLKIELAEKKINSKQKIKTNEGLVLEFIL